MPKSIRLGVIVLALSLLSVLAVSAQSATEEATAQATESADTQFVVQAWTSFTQISGYHFTYAFTSSSALTDKNGQQSSTTSIYSAEGDVDGNNNDTQLSVKSISDAGGVTEEAGGGAPLNLERIVVAGTTYVNLQTDNTPYAGVFGVQDGWWNLADLGKLITDQQTAAALNSFVSLPLPSQLPFSGDLITSVQEQAGTTLQGKAVRVFDVQLNALKVLLEESATGSLAQIFQQANMIAASRLNATLRLWIGADDGQLYQAQGNSESFLPYMSVGHDPDIPYDVQTTSNVSFTISVPQTPAVISAPLSVHTAN